ncbi:hypothetical protein [Arthrobacter sp. zg-Y877]|uniref:hypothetical protein n=1 Tax=Arthrobacter sp. zg-Y877 TaxID=3049074 RepID=UPI0025A32270|nr:hypothetical protein [Arthrobacter sp. zg-Y877]MDM7991450.1 hypothetical protein [Arthrobacter sp. zg-Y877]
MTQDPHHQTAPVPNAVHVPPAPLAPPARPRPLDPPSGMVPNAAAMPASPSPRRNYVLFAAAGLLVGLGAGLLIAQIDLTSTRPSTALIDAVSTCGVEDETGIELGDEGQSLTMDGQGEEYYATGAAYEDIECVLGATGMPDSVSSRMGNTRALDGTQNAQWGDISASWSYHPDSGSNVVLEIVEPAEK